MLMAITQTPREPSMGACQGLLDRSLRTTGVSAHIKTPPQTYQGTMLRRERLREIEIDELSQQKMDLRVLLAFRQTNCLQIMEPQK